MWARTGKMTGRTAAFRGLSSLLRITNGRVFSLRKLHSALSKSEETPLVRQLRSRIQISGPISVAEYMKEVLTNPVAGYYMNKDVFGQKGDFITSPEITQMFGELIGVWCVNEWMQQGSPQPLQIVELGPGRGTLMDDILRVFKQLPVGITENTSIHLVEVSEHLSQMQFNKLAGATPPSTRDGRDEGNSSTQRDGEEGAYMRGMTTRANLPIAWYRHLSDVPQAFSIFIAHEFLDALPIHKFQKKDGNWCEVLVDVDASTDAPHHLRHVLSPGMSGATTLLLQNEVITEGRDHIEVCPQAGLLVEEIAARISENQGAAILADYGHNGDKTDTFRAFRDHQLHDPLCDPGTADLTADVDFSYLARLVSHKVAVNGPITQDTFLHNMGIGYRLNALLANASTEQRKSLITGYDMVTNPEKMGERFKILCLHPKSEDEYLPAGFKKLT